MRLSIVLLLAAAIVTVAFWLVRSATEEYPPIDRAFVAKGRVLFEQHCAACHSARTTGTAPGLGGLFGRQAGTTEFANSPALRAAGFIWDAERLDEFLSDPRGVIPENQMVFYGHDDSEQRAAIIAYIATI